MMGIYHVSLRRVKKERSFSSPKQYGTHLDRAFCARSGEIIRPIGIIHPDQEKNQCDITSIKKWTVLI